VSEAGAAVAVAVAVAAAAAASAWATRMRPCDVTRALTNGQSAFKRGCAFLSTANQADGYMEGGGWLDREVVAGEETREAGSGKRILPLSPARAI